MFTISKEAKEENEKLLQKKKVKKEAKKKHINKNAVSEI